MKAEFDPSPDAYEPGPHEIAGIDLYGERQSDGSVKIGTHNPHIGLPDTRKTMPDFPQEVRVAGAVYTLEAIRKNGDDMDPGRFPPEHPGWKIEWGLYV